MFNIEGFRADFVGCGLVYVRKHVAYNEEHGFLSPTNSCYLMPVYAANAAIEMANLPSPVVSSRRRRRHLFSSAVLRYLDVEAEECSRSESSGSSC